MEAIRSWISSKKLVLILTVVVALVLSITVAYRYFLRADTPWQQLRVEDIDRIELTTFNVEDLEPTKGTSKADWPHIVKDPAEVAYILGTMQRTEHSWTNPKMHFSNAPDRIWIYTRRHPKEPIWGVDIDVMFVAQQFVPEMKLLHDRYFPGSVQRAKNFEKDNPK